MLPSQLGAVRIAGVISQGVQGCSRAGSGGWALPRPFQSPGKFTSPNSLTFW